MSYLLDMLIYVCMILLDNLLQYLVFIVMIYLYIICDSIIILICNVLVISMICPWIKIELKVLIFLTLLWPKLDVLARDYIQNE
jgi:hypothetical protein